MTDEQVTNNVKDALIWDIRVDETKIDVNTKDGVVTLKGSVPSHFQKTDAQAIASRIKGVTDVVNRLKVEVPLPVSDEEIVRDIQSALARDALIEETQVGVSANRGIVTLTGTVTAYDDKTEVEDMAWRTRGVVDVVNEVKVISPITRSDKEMEAEVRNDILRNVRLTPTQIEVSVEGGVVTLSGTVDSYIKRNLAEGAVLWTPGVADVVNNINVILK
jgi:osmotically-inducible protein OsmY